MPAPLSSTSLLAFFARVIARVGDTPDAVAGVITDKKSTILGDSHTDRTAPDIALRGDEASHEVHIFAHGEAFINGHLDDFVPCAAGAIPRAMLSSEGIMMVLFGEFFTVIEGHSQ